MGITYKQTNIHWNLFIAIEKDFYNVSRYIEFHPLNYETFSIELARIIMSSSQEIDVVLKKICKLLEPNSKPTNITEYQELITSYIPKFADEYVFINRFGMKSRPWENWKELQTSPDWWKANNKIKHERVEHFEKANLHNAFNGLNIGLNPRSLER